MSAPAARMKMVEAASTEAQAWPRVIAPRGSSRAMVRGFLASKARSAIRLNPMAAQRAAEKAITTSSTTRGVTGAIAEAASTPNSANGSANSVWGSLTKLT